MHEQRTLESWVTFGMTLFTFVATATERMTVGSVEMESSTSIYSSGYPMVFRLPLSHLGETGTEAAQCFSDPESVTDVSGSPCLPFSFEFGDSSRRSLRRASFMGVVGGDLYFLYEVSPEDDTASTCRFDFPLEMNGATIARTNATHGLSWDFENRFLSQTEDVSVMLNETGGSERTLTMHPSDCSIAFPYSPTTYQEDRTILTVGAPLLFSVSLFPDSDDGYGGYHDPYNDPWSSYAGAYTIVNGNPKLPFQIHFTDGTFSEVKFADYCGVEDESIRFMYATSDIDDSADFIRAGAMSLFLNGASIVRTNPSYNKTWEFRNACFSRDENCTIDFHEIVCDGPSKSEAVVGEAISIPFYRAQKRNSNDIRLRAGSQDENVAIVTKEATISGDKGEPAVFEVTCVAPGTTSIDVSSDDGFFEQFNLTVHPKPTAKNVEVQQRYPWNGLVDITFDLDGDTNCRISLAAVVAGTDEELPVSSVTIADAAETNLLVSSGSVHLVWDAGRDVPGRKFDSVRMTVVPIPVF